MAPLTNPFLTKLQFSVKPRASWPWGHPSPVSVCLFQLFWHGCYPLNPASMQKWLALHHLSTIFLDIHISFACISSKKQNASYWSSHTLLFEANLKILTSHPFPMLWSHCAAKFLLSGCIFGLGIE